MSVVSSYKNHLGRYLALATVLGALVIGTLMYLDHKKQRAVTKIETTVQSVKEGAARTASNLNDKGKEVATNLAKKAREKWKKIRNKDTSQD
jgi:hypothetical protein